MLKNFRLIALSFVIFASCFEAISQTETFKDVLLNGKPAKLNLVTGEVTYVTGEVATNRTAKKLKDSVLSSRTEIKTNLIVDMPSVSEYNDDEMNEEVSVTQMPKVAETTMETQSTETANNLDTDATRIAETVKASVVVEESSKKAQEVAEHYHIVNKNETLYSLAKRYNTTVGKILIANNLETTIIKEGQKLLIYSASASTQTPLVKWTVSKGDTLIGIAKQHNTTVADIKAINNLRSDTIKIGQELKIQQNSEVAKK